MVKYYTSLILLLLLMALWLLGAASNSQKHQESIFSHPNEISSFRIGKDSPLDAQELGEFRVLFNQGTFVKGFYSFIPTKGDPKSDFLEIRAESAVICANGKKVHVNVWYDPVNAVLYVSDDDYDDYGSGVLISNVPPALVRYGKRNPQ